MFSNFNYFDKQIYVKSVNIINFHQEHNNRPDLQIASLRYIYQHFDKTQYKILSKQKLFDIVIQMIQYFILNNNTENVNETIDILLTFSPENRERIMNLDEQFRNRFNRIENAVENKKEKIKIKTIYEDKQNVHNSKINKDVNNIVKYLFKNNSKYFHIPELNLSFSDIIYNENKIIDDIKIELLEDDNKIIEKDKYIIEKILNYIKSSNSIFTDKEITLRQVFLCIWFFIKNNNHFSELKIRMLEEFREMNGLCTTGHLSRLINIIQGFTDDENLIIKIDNHEQYRAVIKNYLSKQFEECKDEIVLEGLIDKNKKYIEFIRLKIADKLLEWLKDYGEEMINEIGLTINTFAGTEIYKI